MKNQCRDRVCLVAAMCVSIGFGGGAAQTPVPAPGAVQEKAPIARHASGTFDVQLKPQGTDDKTDGITTGRMSVDKQFHGDLDGTSKGEMLTAISETKGPAGYVALERVTGKLHGRSGSFILQHSGTLTRGVPQLSVTVVPNSGSGQFMGIAGSMTIKITDGKHFYDFEYTLPETP